MNRRIFGIATAATLVLAATGCEEEPKPNPTATLFNQEKVHEAMKQLGDSLEGLESSVEEFDTTNWREVVPKVREDAEELRDAFDSLRAELGYKD
ncbi:MAG TPA: hypothetical protein VG204_15740 [Terriglobia bacterium]|nr:hypothetical protein [Terriglobia bacterium]